MRKVFQNEYTEYLKSKRLTKFKKHHRHTNLYRLTSVEQSQVIHSNVPESENFVRDDDYIRKSVVVMKIYHENVWPPTFDTIETIDQCRISTNLEEPEYFTGFLRVKLNDKLIFLMEYEEGYSYCVTKKLKELFDTSLKKYSQSLKHAASRIQWILSRTTRFDHWKLNTEEFSIAFVKELDDFDEYDDVDYSVERAFLTSIIMELERGTNVVLEDEEEEEEEEEGEGEGEGEEDEYLDPNQPTEEDLAFLNDGNDDEDLPFVGGASTFVPDEEEGETRKEVVVIDDDDDEEEGKTQKEVLIIDDDDDDDEEEKKKDVFVIDDDEKEEEEEGSKKKVFVIDDDDDDDDVVMVPQKKKEEEEEEEEEEDDLALDDDED